MERLSMIRQDLCLNAKKRLVNSKMDENSIIELHIEQIKSAILTAFFDYDILTVALSGSAARGELALIKYGDFMIPFGDYDYYVVTKKKVPYSLIDNLKISLNKDLFGGTDPRRGTLIDISCAVQSKRFRFINDVAMYDYLKTHKVIYGEKYNEISFNELGVFDY